MYSRNRIDIIGHLGSDPDTRTLESGVVVANFPVAMTDRWNDEDGEKQERTEWIRVSAWGTTAEVVAKYLRKGSYVSVEGSLRTRKYNDKNGVTHYATEVRANNIGFLDRKPEERAAVDADAGDDEDAA